MCLKIVCVLLIVVLIEKTITYKLIEDKYSNRLSPGKPYDRKESSFGWHESHWPLNQQSQNLFSTPVGVIQRIKPSKRTAMETRKGDVQMDFIDESEEFDSDQHIENPNDWHDELDIDKMPHLLGPSATTYSSNPNEYQHFSYTAPPFSCQQILIEFNKFGGPSFSLVPCTYQPFTYNNIY